MNANQRDFKVVTWLGVRVGNGNMYVVAKELTRSFLLHNETNKQNIDFYIQDNSHITFFSLLFFLFLFFFHFLCFFLFF